MREGKGGKVTFLDSRKSLKQAKIKPGTSILVEVMPRAGVIFQPVPPPMLLELPPRVMTRGLDPLLDAGLLSAMRCPTTPTPQRVAALSELVRDTLSRSPCTGVSFEALPLYNTVSHGALLGVLVNHTRELMNGSFRGHNGLPCRTLVGAQEIGKTVTLRAFSLVAASLFPGLVPLYVTAASAHTPCTSFQVAPLDRFMAFAAQRAGTREAALKEVGDDAAPPLPLDSTLRSRGQRMLVLLDEVDQLYKLQPGTVAARNALFSLGTLSDIAEESTGEVGVLLCGSSLSTFKLVCGGGGGGAMSPHLQAKYPLSTSGAVLKGDKYPRILLPSSTCISTGEVEHILAVLLSTSCRNNGLPKALPEALLPLARLLTFFMGAKPRAVEAALFRDKDTKVVELNLGLATPAALTDGSLDAPAPLALYHMIMAMLVAKNHHLRDLILGGQGQGEGRRRGQASVTLIMDPDTHWEDALVPLHWDAVVETWAKRKGRMGRPLEGDVTELAVLLDDLSDRHMLHCRHTPYGVEVWPVTAAQLVAREIGTEWLKATSAQALATLAPLVQLLHVASSVPTVAGAIKGGGI